MPVLKYGGASLTSTDTTDVGIPRAFDFMNRLVEWEIREPGVLPRYALEEARKRYPVKYPCFVELDGKWLFARLEDEGVTVFTDGLSPEVLSKIFALTRLGPLLTLPVQTRNGEVRMDEEFMKQLAAEYEKRISERGKSEETP